MIQSDNKKILVVEVVEDEISQRKALVEKFSHEGFQVLEATNGDQGLQIAIKEMPDIIILDVLMPDADGMTMLKKLRLVNSWGKSVPVVILTNISPDDEGINKRIAEDEPAYYLMKSDHTIDDVVDKVKERLSRQT